MKKLGGDSMVVQLCPRCGEAMRVSHDPVPSSGSWVSYQCSLEVCAFRFKVFECGQSATRSSVATPGRRAWRRRAVSKVREA